MTRQTFSKRTRQQHALAHIWEYLDIKVNVFLYSAVLVEGGADYSRAVLPCSGLAVSSVPGTKRCDGSLDHVGGPLRLHLWLHLD